MGQSLAGFDRQLRATAGQHSQREMPFLSAVPLPHLLDAAVLARSTFCGVMADAARYSGMDDCHIAEAINVCPGYMSRLMRSVGQQWARRMVEFCRVTQSLGPVQWMADQLGCDLVQRDSRAAEVAALRQRLQDLERAA